MQGSNTGANQVGANFGPPKNVTPHEKRKFWTTIADTTGLPSGLTVAPLAEDAPCHRPGALTFLQVFFVYSLFLHPQRCIRKPNFAQFFPNFHPKLPPESFRTLRIRCSRLSRFRLSYSRPNPWELDPVLSPTLPQGAVRPPPENVFLLKRKTFLNNLNFPRIWPKLCQNEA